MLNKKAIAAFAAGATLVSGLVFAAPAMAEPPVNGGSTPTVQSADATELKGVVFNFKVGKTDHKTTAMTLYKKGDKYGADKSDINYTIAQIGAGLLAQVQNDLTPAQGDSVVDTGTVGTIAYPKTIEAGENTVTVTLTYKSDVTDDVVTTMAGLGDFKTFEATLKQQKKKISPAQKALFDAQRAKVEEAISKDKAKKDALIAEAERFGLPKSVVDALKHYAESKESAAVARLLEQGKKNAREELAKKAEKEGFTFVAKLIRNSKKSTLTALKALLAEAEREKRNINNGVAPAVNNVPEYNGADLFNGLTYEQAKALYEEMNANAEAAKKTAKDGKLDADTVKLLAQAKAAFQKIVKAEIEKIAKQAEKEGFTFVAKLIRKAKTVEGARALLAEAEKSKKLTPKPINPLTPVPSQPSGNGAGTGNGAGNAAGNTNDNKTTKNATKNAANVAAPLAKTGAAVALAAVAASVLAGMGVALRKIRH
ncbi:hypothetical protein CG401_00025 [Bifidobacteriaceae bacterium NR019]|nr:hypothetical protein CG401_00025 [Bifidobacteriaceae bacterium NR019]RFT36691.1 hypothetical protein CG400_02010 [Bifidobacteriaceae bacterium NR017]